ncbi:MAG: glycosyltransferase [Deltaproteobacteria bacterium]|nr:glycosyltransferase [Deltaproteobacteria bacterium]
MRIFYASERSPNAFIKSDLWRENLYGSLVDLGHDVVELDFDLSETFRHLDPTSPADRDFIAVNRPAVSRELLRQLKRAHEAKPIDLFFSYFYDACITPETIEAIRALGVKTVNWYCNASYQLHLVREIAPKYDWCLVPEKFRLDDYRKLGANPLYCQEAANPRIYHPVDVPQTYDVSFIGQAYGERPEWMAELVKRGIDVHVFGQGWKRFCEPRVVAAARRLKRGLTGGAPAPRVRLPRRLVGGVLDDRALVEAYSRSKINLGFATVGSTHETGKRIVQVRLRDFEIPMSGGFYIAERFDELGEFFEFGKEIETYSSREELADKIRFYLGNTEARERIRHAGRERCLRHHTWTKRFADAFARIGL